MRTRLDATFFLSLTVLVVACGEPAQYGYDLPPTRSDGFTPIGAVSPDAVADSIGRLTRRAILAEILGEESLLQPASGVTLRTWFLRPSDSAPAWVAVRVSDTHTTATKIFVTETTLRLAGKPVESPRSTMRAMSPEEQDQFRAYLQAAALWDLAQQVKTGTVDTICADCAEPHCEIEIREDARYYLVGRSHHVLRGDTVGLRPADARFYRLCTFLHERGGA